MSTPQPPQNAPLGPVLRALREGAGLSIYGLAKAAHLDRGHLHRVEAGERSISPESLHRIVQAVADRMNGRQP